VKAVTANTLLEPREMLLVDIGVGVADPGLAWTTTDIGVNEKIQVQVQPPVGSALTIDRTLPPYMAATQWYEVY
jgi:archaellin